MCDNCTANERPVTFRKEIAHFTFFISILKMNIVIFCIEIAF